MLLAFRPTVAAGQGTRGWVVASVVDKFTGVTTVEATVISIEGNAQLTAFCRTQKYSDDKRGWLVFSLDLRRQFDIFNFDFIGSIPMTFLDVRVNDGPVVHRTAWATFAAQGNAGEAQIDSTEALGASKYWESENRRIPPAAFDTVHKYVVQLDLYGKGHQVATFLIPNSRKALNAVCRSHKVSDTIP